MRDWLMALAVDDALFMPHGHCFLRIPSLLWLHVTSDVLIGTAYLGIAVLLFLLVRRLRLPFGPVIVAFGLFIGLCGGTHFMEVWTVWRPDYWASGVLKASTALASVATAIGLLVVKPRIEAFTAVARLSEERRLQLESAHTELESVYQRLKDADAFRSRFFANVSHELRTPLSLILGPARRMKEADNLTADQQRSLDWICDNGTLLLRQVEDLLDLARIDADRITLDASDLDLVPWSRTLLSHFAGTVSERRLRLSLDAPDRLVARVDAALLSRAVTNLLANAMKYTPDGGQVLVTLAARDGSALLSVADDGPGVPVGQRDAIFERFNRGDPEMSRRAGGTGLGLAIAKDFAELHGGRLTVADAALGGALFTIELPLGASADAAPSVVPNAASPVAAPADPSSPTIGAPSAPVVERHEVAGDLDRSAGLPLVLVVEDNAQMSSFVSEVLADDFVVRTAADGVEGLALIESLAPDLVISDIAMPRMDGEAMLAALRGRREFDAIAVLMLTARADGDLRVRLLRAGAQDFLVKPLLPAELRARARNLVAAKRAGDTLRGTLSSLSSDLEGLAREMAIKNRHLATTLADVEIARQAAERASLVKSSFLGLLSHEIRTPLSSILMNLELLARDRNVGLAAGVKNKVDRLTVAARQLNALMEGLLEYTRFERGGIEATAEAVDPRVLAGEVVEEYRSLRDLGEIELTLAPASAPPATELRTDPRLLRVILSNLINNALKFTVRGSVTVRVVPGAEDCAIEVRDTGPGIPPESLARIFLPFEQLEPLHGKSLPGVGLGLALVRQITEALHGRIEVDSVVGQGSTFRIVLPGMPAAIQTSGDHA